MTKTAATRRKGLSQSKENSVSRLWLSSAVKVRCRALGSSIWENNGGLEGDHTQRDEPQRTERAIVDAV